MSPANILLIVAGVVGAAFFFSFFRLMAREPDQRALVTGAKPGKVVNVVVTVPLALLLVFGPPQAKLLAAAAIFPAMLFITWWQHRWLLAHGAKRAFLNRLSVASAMGGLALAAFAAAMVLGA